MPLRTFQLPEIAVEDFGIPDRWATVRANGKRGDSEIDANGLARRLNGFRNIFFDQDADEPLTSPLANCCGEHLDTTGGDVATFLQSKSASNTTNLILDEKVDVWSKKLNVSSFPTVFVFNQDGKYEKRYPEDQEKFNYEDIGKVVAGLLKK